MKGNLDIQPEFNHNKVVTYTCTYFSKEEEESSETMNQAAKERK